MYKAIGKGWVENDLPPIFRYELAVFSNTVARWRLHPAIDGQDPRRRHQCAKGDHGCGKHM